MKLDVYFGDFQPAQIVQQDVADLIHDEFDKYQKHIRAVNLFVTDVNGPKGGVDKQCRCVIHLKRMSPVVIQDHDISFVALIRRVAARAKQSLARRVEQRQSSFRPNRRYTTEASSGLDPLMENQAIPELQG